MTVHAIRELLARLHVALWYAFLLVIAIAVVGAFLLTTLDSNLRREVDEVLMLRALNVQHGITSENQAISPERVGANILGLAPLDEFTSPGIYVQVLDANAMPLGSSPNLPGGQLPAPAEVISGAVAGRQAYVTVPVGKERVRLLAMPVSSGGQVSGVILVGESLHMLDATQRRLRQLLGMAAFVTALLSLVGGWWVRMRSMRPVADVTRVARQIAATGQFEQRIAIPETQDELRDLVTTFNDMLARLERTFRRQRDFLADASHELRGPLMVIMGNLDLLQMELPQAERRESAREARDEAQRMSRLVSDLLFLAEEDAQERLEHRPVPLHEVLFSVWERACTVDAAKHQVVIIHNDATIVQGDRDRLAQMIWNLVENALRYTGAGGRVSLGLLNHGQVAELTVADTGLGIAPEHLRHIFERFYRVDRARSHRYGSSGLGLAIVKQVVEAHGGQVRVRSEQGVGTTFTVALPV